MYVHTLVVVPVDQCFGLFWFDTLDFVVLLPSLAVPGLR